MGYLLERYGKIDLGELLRVDLRQLNVLLFIMIFAAVIVASVDLNGVGLNIVSYACLAINLSSTFFLIALYARRAKVTWFVFLVSLFSLFWMLSSIVNGIELKQCFYSGCSLIFLAILCDYYQDRFYFIVASFAIAFAFCAYWNLFYLLSHPELWIIDVLKTEKGYLLGANYNQMGCRLLCAVAASVACQRYSKWWIVNTIPVTIVSLISLSLVGSMTSLTGITLFVLLTLIPSRNLLKLAIVSLLASVILFQVFVCFQGKGLENNELAVYFIEDVLEKDITFSRRTYLWDAASKLFWASPVYGHGCVSGDWYLSNMSARAQGPHNFIWFVLIQGGLIMLAVFTSVCLITASKFVNTKARSVLNIYAAIAILCLMMIMEVYPTPFIFFLLSMAFFMPRTTAESPVKESAAT